MTKRIALYPGTFDPMTLGHLDIMKRASNLCDKIVIAVATNNSKGGPYSRSMSAPIRDRIEV